jgi:membrane protein DedA with SNARE-associated domain
MDSQVVLDFIQQYGYWILYPLMIIEGPLITLLAGGLSATGILNVWLVFLLSLLGDLSMDVILYYIGFFGNKRLRQRIAQRPKLESRRVKLEKFFQKHGGKVVFFVKISTGLAYITFITAGMIRLPLRRFIFFTLLGGIIWSGALVALGYFYGQLYLQISNHIRWAGVIVFSGAILTFLILTLLRKWKAKQFLTFSSGEN